MKSKVNYMMTCALLALLSILFILLAVYMNNLSKQKEVITNLTYKQDSNVNYTVNLKENSFFNTDKLTKEYLENGNKTIITQLIDTIDLNYDYTVTYDNLVSGSYTYYIKALIEANKSDSTNYWNREYILTDKKTVQVENTSTYTLRSGVKISYDEYNDILSEFKKKLNLPAMGEFSVNLIVENDITTDGFDEAKKIEAVSIVSLPLGLASTEISVNTAGANKSGVLTEKAMKYENKYTVYKVLSYIMAILFIVIILIEAIVIKGRRKKEMFNIQLNKILSTYDSIIVNVKSLPNLRNFNVIMVNSFEELIDAHSEVRMPINYYTKRNRHIFLLVNDKMAWLYEFKHKDGE